MFLDDMARLGRLYDTADLGVTSVSGGPAGAVTVVSPSGYAPVDVETASLSENGADRSGFGVAMVADSAPAAPQSRVGLGFGAGVNAVGMNYKSGACATQFFTPQYAAGSDHRLTTCWEKWKSSSDARYIYNRWAWFTRANPAGGYAGTLDFTIRSRPWAGHEGKVTAFLGHTPAFPNNDCGAQANASLSVGPGSLSIPVHRCASTSILENANTKSGGMDWNGQTAGQLFLDFGIAINTNAEPVYADYSWMEVCKSLVAATCPGNPSQYLIRKDSGY